MGDGGPTSPDRDFLDLRKKSPRTISARVDTFLQGEIGGRLIEHSSITHKYPSYLR